MHSPNVALWIHRISMGLQGSRVKPVQTAQAIVLSQEEHLLGLCIIMTPQLTEVDARGNGPAF